MNRSELIERRKTERFQAQGDIFIRLSSNRQRYWKIIDISKGGLAFRYVASEARTNGSAVLNILTTDRRFCLEKIPAKIIRDSAMPGEFSLGSITLRHCAVQFGELIASQKLDLEHFIRSNTLTWSASCSAHVKGPGRDLEALHVC